MSEVDDGLLDESLLDNEPEKAVEIVVEQDEPVAEPETEPVAEEPAPEEPTTGSDKEPWTLTAVLDEREKRQKAQKEAEELRERLKAYEKPEDDVSVFENEKEFVSQQQQKIQSALRNTELNMSQAFAESVYGEEKVAAAVEWFKTEGVQSPTALKRFNSAKLPFHELIKMHDDDAAFRNPEGYKAKIRAEVEEELRAKYETKPKTSTPSLASKRSVGDHIASLSDIEDILNK